MTEEGSSNPFDADEFVNQWEGLSPGHQEDQSRPTNEIEEMDITNKLTSVSTRSWIWERQGASGDQINELKNKSVDKLLELFPNRRDYIKSYVSKNDDFENQRSKFEEPPKEG